MVVLLTDHRSGLGGASGKRANAAHGLGGVDRADGGAYVWPNGLYIQCHDHPSSHSFLHSLSCSLPYSLRYAHLAASSLPHLLWPGPQCAVYRVHPARPPSLFRAPISHISACLSSKQTDSTSTNSSCRADCTPCYPDLHGPQH